MATWCCNDRRSYESFPDKPLKQGKQALTIFCFSFLTFQFPPAHAHIMFAGSCYCEWKPWIRSFRVDICLGCHLRDLPDVLGIGQSISSHCSDGWIWSLCIVQWRLPSDIQIFWIHYLGKLLVHPGRLADFFLLQLCSRLNILLSSNCLTVFLECV